MKLTCDLCSSPLQVNPGGQAATCINCGLSYSMDRLREKLSDSAPAQQKPAFSQPIPLTTNDRPVHSTPVNQEPTAATAPFVPLQFIMENNQRGRGDLCGIVRQGGIGVGDSVYIDGDYSHPYRVYLINDDSAVASVKAGMPAELYLVSCPRKVLKNAHMITGIPNPVANAYNFPGSVHEYFSTLIQQNFSNLRLLNRVPHRDLTIPVNYLFYRGDVPVLALFVINSNDNRARYQVQKAAKVLGAMNIGTTHFFEDYRNDAPYVIKRIRGVLG